MAKRKKSHAKKVARQSAPRKSARKTSRQKTTRQRDRHSRGTHAPNRSHRRISAEERRKLSAALKLIRKHVHGYTPAEGYSVRLLSGFTAAKRRRLITKAGKLKELTATPHDLVRAPTPKARRSLVQFTRQRLRKAKHFIVHKPEDRFRVRLREGNVAVVHESADGRVRTESRYFLFPRRPRSPADAERMTEELMRTMPKGFYSVLTGALGDTGEPVQREMLLRRLQEYMSFYSVDQEGRETGFTQAIIGFRFMATSLDGAVARREAIDHRRQRVKEWHARQKAALRRGQELEDYNEWLRQQRVRKARQAGARRGWKKRKGKR